MPETVAYRQPGVIGTEGQVGFRNMEFIIAAQMTKILSFYPHRKDYTSLRKVLAAE